MKSFLQALTLVILFAVAAYFCSASDALKEWRDRRRTKQGLDVDAMLKAIAEVETGGNWRAIGKLGERGRCQFLSTTWSRYTTAAFDLWAPQDCELSRKVEKAHLAFLCAQLLKCGLKLEPETVAGAWCYGSGAATRGARSDYAKRAANLYREFTARVSS
jgi:hypothetical protein